MLVQLDTHRADKIFYSTVVSHIASVDSKLSLTNVVKILSDKKTFPKQKSTLIDNLSQWQT